MTRLLFYRFVIGLRIKRDSVEETPLHFNMLTNMTIKGKGEKSIIIHITGCGKQHYTVMLAITVARRKLPHCVIFKRKTMPKAKLPKSFYVHV
jgi:hypothetical protein